DGPGLLAGSRRHAHGRGGRIVPARPGGGPAGPAGAAGARGRGRAGAGGRRERRLPPGPGRPAAGRGARMRAPTRPGPGAATRVAATGAGAAAGVALAILVLAGVFIAVAVPRASLGYRTQVVQRIFHAAPSQKTAVLGDANLSGLSQGHLGAAELAVAGR